MFILKLLTNMSFHLQNVLKQQLTVVFTKQTFVGDYFQRRMNPQLML